MHTNQLPNMFRHKYNCHHIITHTSYFYHVFTQLLLYNNTHNTNSTFISRPPLHISSFLHPQHANSMSSQSNILQRTHNIFFSSLTSLYFTSYFALHSANWASNHIASYLYTIQEDGLHISLHRLRSVGSSEALI